MMPTESMTALPIELIALTCRWLGAPDLRSMRLVSRDVSAVATPTTFETLTFSPSTIACLFAEFPHLLPHVRCARLLYDGDANIVESLIDMFVPWPYIRTLHVLDDGRDKGADLPRAIRKTKALLSARADAQQFRVKFSGHSSHYMVVAEGSTISLSVSEAQLQRRTPPMWLSQAAWLLTSLAMSRCVIWQCSIFEVLPSRDITSLELAEVHIQAAVDVETGLPLFTWAAIWNAGWPSLVALSVTGCGYVGANPHVRLRDDRVGTHTLQNDAHAFARLDAQIQHAAAHRPRTEAVGDALSR